MPANAGSPSAESLSAESGKATLDDALLLAAQQFRGVRDKAGQPYILHCLRVMLAQADDITRQAAVLHDVVEDTDVTLAELRQRGYAHEVVEAVDALTHRDDETYHEYVLRLSECAVARPVKLADLQDNYRLDRVAYRKDHQTDDAVRIQKYILTHQFLTMQIDRATYVECMSSLAKGKA
jgi:(p)ppGpp synthase/HD superfamily hydrolase